MSHYMTALAMKQRGLKPAAKIVLYWLADHHNGETGRCFPSLARLAEVCEMSKRSVQDQIAALQEAGLISIENAFREDGQQTANSFAFHLQADEGWQNLPSGVAKSARGGWQNLPANNLGRDNPGSEQDTPLPPKGGRAEANEISETLCAWASPDAVASFIAYRKRTKGKALTLTAAKRLASNLQEIFNAGGDTDDALGLAEERGWQSVKPEWYFNDKQRSDRGANRPGSGMAAAFAAVAARSTPRQG
jgi:hypothetical protein